MALGLEKAGFDNKMLIDNNIRLTTIGDVSSFPADVLETLHETEILTAENDGRGTRLALNYGSRQEIINAVRALCADIRD